MKFIDEVILTIASGSGGDGVVSFRREKFIPFGGPDGGNGGRGGSIYIRGDRNVNTLLHLKKSAIVEASSGENGRGKQQHGRSGEDKIISVPLGTFVFERETGEILYDITEHGQNIQILEGGEGGIGNMYFKSSVRQAPKFAKPGFPGKRMDIRLELKLMADVGLLGFPNAGKSTLISVCSAASPKIANYPFTTLAPQLGVVSVGDDSFVMADIPGIIEGASEGKGLGLRFLKHLERTNILLHLVDISMCPTTFDSFERYIILRQELEKYDPHLFQKKEMIVFTKIDALSEEKIQEHVQFFENQLGKKILPISSVSGKNLNQLKNILWKTIQKERG